MSSQKPAFYVHLTHSEKNLSPHHVLVYDYVGTNVGNGYNKFTGVFSVPKTGTYVFLWKVRMRSGVSVTELVVNNSPMTAIEVDGGLNFFASTGFAVVEVTTGDVVFVRTHSTLTDKGLIWTDDYGRTSFAGWAI